MLTVEGWNVTVDFLGVRRRLRLDIVDESVSEGGYVMNHVGFAIRRISAEEIGETLALSEMLLREAWREDLLAAVVRGEIAAAGKMRDD